MIYESMNIRMKWYKIIRMVINGLYMWSMYHDNRCSCMTSCVRTWMSFNFYLIGWVKIMVVVNVDVVVRALVIVNRSYRWDGGSCDAYMLSISLLIFFRVLVVIVAVYEQRVIFGRAYVK